jgi:hypothetical protein
MGGSITEGYYRLFELSLVDVVHGPLLSTAAEGT